MLQKGCLKKLYDEIVVAELEDRIEKGDELSSKEQKKYDSFKQSKPIFDTILGILKTNISDKKWLSSKDFLPVLNDYLSEIKLDKKLIESIADGLSVMDKTAEIQKDKKGNVLYDDETKDIEIVKFNESIEDYMAREVLPYVPDAVSFFEENIKSKKTVIKTGAEIPFTKYFYKYQSPTSSDELKNQFIYLEKSVNDRISKLFEEK